MPNTKMVLGGVLSRAGPMAPEVANHVAAVALFGKPSSGFLQTIDTGAPPITVGHLYSGKTTDLCIPEDAICSPGGNDNGAHILCAVNGMADQAADFAAHHLSSSGAAAIRTVYNSTEIRRQIHQISLKATLFARPR
jgi:hypothetical protein